MKRKYIGKLKYPEKASIHQCGNGYGKKNYPACGFELLREFIRVHLLFG